MKPRLLPCLVCLLVALIWCPEAQAHKDTIIQLKGNELTGLPQQYLPAELNVKESRLRVGSHEMTFTPLLKGIFGQQPQGLQVTASWYHRQESGSLPPYLSIRLQPEKKDVSYQLLFSLDTLELIKLSRHVKKSGTVTREYPAALSKDQKEEIKSSIKKVR